LFRHIAPAASIRQGTLAVDAGTRHVTGITWALAVVASPVQPSARMQAACAVVFGQIFVFGGLAPQVGRRERTKI
jgi:hypothetical protein